MTNCRNCNHQIEENYCPKCGQTAKLKRIDGQYLIHEIQHVFHFENGFLYTIRELLTRPGESVRIYIAENRSLLVKPLIFIIITSLIYTLTTKLFQIEDGYVIYDETEKSITGIIFNLVQHHYGYANIIMGVFTALWARIFFYKVDYNFYEILILLCFAMGIGMLIYSVFAIFQGLTNFDLMRIAGFLAMAYCTWAIGQFFDKKKTINYVKAFVSYALGMFSFFLSTLFVGALIELITNQKLAVPLDQQIIIYEVVTVIVEFLFATFKWPNFREAYKLTSNFYPYVSNIEDKFKAEIPTYCQRNTENKNMWIEGGKWIVIIFGIFFIAVGGMMLIKPKTAREILRSAGSTNFINYAEITLRMIPAIGLILVADQSKFTAVFKIMGWFMLFTSCVLYFVPRGLHYNFSNKCADLLKPVYFQLISPFAFLIGILIIYSVY